ncbi:MAG: Mu transposase C-terminal domain-containing protein [Ostreibacterium sp.]
MAIFRNKNGVCAAEAHRTLAKQWGAKHGNTDGCPSIGQVNRALSRIPGHIKEIGRKTGAEYRAMKTYVKRDWSMMSANDCWVGDGHSMKMKVRHPDHGQPFTPELTLIMDTASRFIVGWSLSYSESTIAVADALRHGMQNHGIPAIYYSDNGGGQKNKALDADITGILPRLGVHHETGIPGNPQGRGIIERVNKTLALYIARQFETYYGQGSDDNTVREALTGTKSLAKAVSEGKKQADLTVKQRRAQGKLPSWSDLLTEIEAGVSWYNTEHKHREISNVTPFEMRRWLLAEGDEHDIIRITDTESREFFRPEFIRRVQRGWVSHHNNDYWHKTLENHDGEDVIVCVDIHDADNVIIRDIANHGWICDANWNGNKRAAFPETLVEKSRHSRAKAAMKRLDDKKAQVNAELRPTLEHQASDMLVIPAKDTSSAKKYDFLAEPIKKAN